MSKLSATLSKKVPIPGLEYSSQQFTCGLEMDLAGEQTQDTIRQNIHKLYVLLHQTVDREIQIAIDNPPLFLSSIRDASQTSHEPSTPRWRGGQYGGRDNRWSRPGGPSRYGPRQSGRATQAQVKAIFAIAKNNGMERRDILEMLEERFNVTQPDHLSVKQASKLIETLKGDDGDRE